MMMDDPSHLSGWRTGSFDFAQDDTWGSKKNRDYAASIAPKSLYIFEVAR